MKIRATAANVIYQVVEQGQSLSAALPTAQQQVAAKDRALLQEICYGTLRWLNRLEFIAEQLIDRQLKGKHRPLHYLILAGLYQFVSMFVLTKRKVYGAFIKRHSGLRGRH